MPRSESIERIRKRFQREWLLIAIDKLDEATTTPLTGRLIAHSPHREDIHDTMLRRKGLALITYSDDCLPAGYAVAF
jgi:hypothetical protein